jgi:2TM family of unknown function (DUF5676)
MRTEKVVLANAFALTVAIVWVVCSLLIAVLPAFFLTVTTWWMHGLALSTMGTWNLTWGNFFLGGVTLVVAAWLSAYLFGWCWEIVSGKQSVLPRKEGVQQI